MKEYEITIDRFDGGNSDDPRVDSGNQFAASRNFDIHAYPKKLYPLRDFIADENNGSSSTGMRQYHVQDFGYYASTGQVFGLGTKSDGTGTQVFRKDSLTDTTWEALSGLSSPLSLNVRPGSFFKGSGGNFYFLADDDVYITDQNGNIGAAIDDLPSFDSNSNGLLGRDAFFYIGTDHRLIRIDSITSADEAISFPDEYSISSLTLYGNYLAIAVEPNSNQFRNSLVYIWDYSSSDPTETIDWGPGSLKVLENVDGVLIGVSDEFMSGNIGNDTGKMVIREYRGGTPSIVKEVTARASGGYVRKSKATRGSRLRFAASVPQSATETYEGIWSYGSKGAGYANALTLELADPSFSSIQAFAQLGNFDFVAHSGNGAISRTADTESYATASVYESQIFSRNYEGVLEEVELTTDPLPSGASVTVKYRINGSQTASDWTSIGSLSAAGNSYVQFTRPESDEFRKHHEVQFRIESTGGGIPVRLRARYAELSSNGAD